MKIFPIIFFLLFSHCLFSQVKKTDSVKVIYPDSNKIKSSVYLSSDPGNSEKFRYDSLYIWSDKRSLSEILDERTGYFIFDFGLGGRNDINYNSKYSREVGIFRDGIQLNDNFYQGFDIQNLSVNEIERIEEISNTSSFFYGINSFAKSINIISKDVFNTKPFSQLRYSQDREGALSADFYYSQPVSRKLNVQLGITKHSSDGRYENSDYNIWRGRARINYYASQNLNIKLNFYINNYDRGLNDGLYYRSNKDSLADPSLAKVVHPLTNENLENYYFDLTASGKFFKNKNSETKIKIYGINSLRNLINPDIDITFSNFPEGYYHSIQYGAEVMQNIFIPHNKNTSSDLNFGGNFYYNAFNGNLFKKYDDRYYSLRFKYDFNYKRFFASAFFRNDFIKNENFFNYGLETNYGVYSSRDWELSLSGGYNETKYLLRNESFWKIYNYKESSMLTIPRKYYEAGGKIKYKDITLSGYIFGFSYDSTYDSQYGVNTNLNINVKYFSGNIGGSYSQGALFPQYYFKGDIAYKDILFRGKLKLKTGFDFKYYRINYLTEHYQTWYSFNNEFKTFSQEDQFIVDFYVGARIGRANINLTVANIFNSLVYNAYIFPLDDRGGFLNAISRFTIVWDFIN